MEEALPLDIVLIVGAIIGLLALSALFNGAETALTAHSRARMHALEQEGNARAALVNRLLRNPERLIGAVLLGNTLVDILAASLASGLAVIILGPAGVAYATAIMTLLIVIFSAVLPKTYALAFADRTALLLAPWMRVMIALLSPVTAMIQWIVRFLLTLTPSKQDDAANILAQPAIQDRLTAQGMVMATLTPSAFAKAIKDETAVWAGVIRSRGIKAD